MITNTTHKNELISPARKISGRVELFNGSTLLNTFTHTDALTSIDVNRAGSKKFFGYGVCQEAEIKLVDKERVINIEENQILKISFIAKNSTVSPTPLFYISEVKRDENTNALTVKAYDAIYKAKAHTVAELNLEAPYSLLDVIAKIAAILGVSFNLELTNRVGLNTTYPEGANFEGSETLREVLDFIAEATQSIYYMTRSNALSFKQLDIAGAPVLTINKSDYFTLERNQQQRTLATVVSATELGDNVSIEAPGVTGETQYLRDNPFLELREDITSLLENAISVVGGLTLNEFNCSWRGNYLVEPGDKISIVTKDDGVLISYLLNDKYSYNGGFSSKSEWTYAANENESVDNPVTIGDALKKTYAKVDKANANIEIVAGETAAIKLNNEAITASVNKVSSDVVDVTQEVSTKVTAEDVNFTIQTAISDGVEKVTTTTGFTFNEQGLKVSKSDSEISTNITEDGMTVYKNDTAVLVADNQGVKAEDLHATTYLIVGNNSRFEDYGSRTGCFWIAN
jgi:hypothetical protein